jgi:G patch domain-containing protein 1
MTQFIYTLVATLIGWAPSTFVSSRRNRSDHREFKPEDFMDEEDLEVFIITLSIYV